MLARLLLALLIAMLPMPAAAACHAIPATLAAHHHGMKHEPVKQLAEPLCIGCVAPATARAPELSRPIAFARVHASPAYLPGAPRSAAPPATPPPRSNA